MKRVIYSVILLLFLCSSAPAIDFESGFDSGALPASQISVDTTPFNGNLSSTDWNVQEALETIDDMSAGGGAASGVTTDTTDFDGTLSSADDTVQKALDTLDDAIAGAGTGDIQAVGNCTTGNCFVDGTNHTLFWEGATTNGIETSLSATDPTGGDQLYLFPDMATTGTFTLLTEEGIDTFAELNALVADQTLVHSNSNIATATALAADGDDCSAGNAPLGVDEFGDVEGCFDVWTEAENTSAGYLASGDIDTYSELNAIVADVTLTHNGLIDTFSELDAIVADKALVNKADGAVWLGAHDFGGATSLEVPNSETPTVTTTGTLAFDTNGWGTSRGTMVFHDGSSTTMAVNVQASDTPSNGQVPTFNTGGTITWEAPSASDSVARQTAFGITIDGGGEVIETGGHGCQLIPYDMTVTGWHIAETSVTPLTGSIVIDVWADSTYQPDVSDTIAGSEKPTLTAQTSNSDSSLGTWTTAITEGDYVCFFVDAASTVERINLTVSGDKG